MQVLSRRIAEQGATYTNIVAELRRLVEMVEACEEQSNAIVKKVEQEWVVVNEARVEELERVLEKVNRVANSRLPRLSLLYHRLLREG